MKQLFTVCFCISLLMAGCLQKARAPIGTLQAPIPQHFEHAWVMSSGWDGEMGVAIALTTDQYYYWFYSDVKLENEPEYPMTGRYTFVDGKLRLNGSNYFYYATNWIVVSNGGRKCLSAERDVDNVERYLIPDTHFNPRKPFENQGTLKAEPTKALYSTAVEGTKQ